MLKIIDNCLKLVSSLSTKINRVALNKSCNRSLSLQPDVEATQYHTPVMVKQVIEYLQPKENNIIIDMTFGAGGHSKQILKEAKNIKLFGLDRDPVAFEHAKELHNVAPNFIPLRGKFSELPQLLALQGINQGSVDGILFDFGCSSMQFDEAHRGFSISKVGPLDMRMDNTCNDPTAAEVLASIREEDLAKILRTYGEEKQAKKIARAVVESRHSGISLQTTKDLSDLVANVCGSDHRQDKLQRHAHSATKMFQALRIFINDELNEINYAMILAHYYLKVGGKMITLTFHSLEDTIVKRHIQGNVLDNLINTQSLKDLDSNLCQEMNEPNHIKWKQINKHVITPSEEEIYVNPRSRSAKLRAVVKIK